MLDFLPGDFLKQQNPDRKRHRTVLRVVKKTETFCDLGEFCVLVP